MDKHPRGFLVARAGALLTEGGLMLDLGAGDGSYWEQFLAERPRVRYGGVEIAPARRPLLPNMRIVAGDCTDLATVKAALGGELADLVVSKSAIEHIYPERRAAFLRTAHECLSPACTFLLQYDQGHFMCGRWQDLKSAIARPLHRLRAPRVQYAKPLDIDAYEEVIHRSSFEIVTKHYTGVADIKRLIGALQTDVRGEAERRWVAFEKYANLTFPEAVLRRHFTGLVWELRRL